MEPDLEVAVERGDEPVEALDLRCPTTPLASSMCASQLIAAVLRTLLRALPFEQPLVDGPDPKALPSFSNLNGTQGRLSRWASALGLPSVSTALLDALSVTACRLVSGLTRTEQLALVVLAPAMIFLEKRRPWR
jgi:hypothetical protein